MKTLFNPEEIIKRIDYDNSKVCWPFALYVGDSYKTATIKIMIIGKATYGWGKANGDNLNSIDRTELPTTLQNLSREFISR